MRAFAEAWCGKTIVQAVLAHIRWYRTSQSSKKLTSAEDRIWYARATFNTAGAATCSFTRLKPVAPVSRITGRDRGLAVGGIVLWFTRWCRFRQTQHGSFHIESSVNHYHHLK